MEKTACEIPPYAAKAGAVLLVVVLLCMASLCLTACSGSSGSSGESVQGVVSESTTSGSAFKAKRYTASYHDKTATGESSARIDTGSLEDGYVAAKAKSSKGLKFQVEKDGFKYNYDLSNTGKATVFPLNMGSGSYRFSILQNTTGNRYALVYSVEAEVELGSEFEPYLRPNIYCDFDKNSDCVAKAAELTADAENQGDVLEAIYNYVVENIDYDSSKAKSLSGKSGYYPNPDLTLSSGKGICFDYSSLTAAMLRSVGIPCKIVTGYITGQDLYHAWNMVYIDGAWHSVEISVDEKTWTLLDTTYAAGSSGMLPADEVSYREKYEY